MVQKSGQQPPGMVLKPYKQWDKLPTVWTGAGISAINSIKGKSGKSLKYTIYLSIVWSTQNAFHLTTHVIFLEKKSWHNQTLGGRNSP